jgi:dTDP-4-amino-4,6-dideoxygalactose transaminase
VSSDLAGLAGRTGAAAGSAGLADPPEPANAPTEPLWTDGVASSDVAWEEAFVAEDINAGFAQVMLGDSFVRRPFVASCEKALAQYCGVHSTVGVASGTDALELALRAGGVGPGDECLLPANAPPTTVAAVLRCGAEPVFVDIVADTTLIDDEGAIAVAHAGTAAIIPVHRHGRAVDVSRLRATADRCTALLLEDATEAAGARIGGRMAGALADIAALGFMPGSNLAARTDGGAVVTDTPELVDHVRQLRARVESARRGGELGPPGSRLDALQSVVVAGKLRRLDGWNVLRRAAAGRYTELLAEVPDVATPPLPPLGQGEQHVWCRYVVRVPAARRDEIVTGLLTGGIQASVPPGAVSPPGRCPKAEQVAAESMALPLFPAIRPEQQERVVETLRGLL